MNTLGDNGLAARVLYAMRMSSRNDPTAPYLANLLDVSAGEVADAMGKLERFGYVERGEAYGGMPRWTLTQKGHGRE